MEQGILDKTGKPLAHWVDLLRKSGLTKHGEMIKLLKTEHGFTHGYANFAAHKARESDAASHDGDDLVAVQYEKKQSLKPIYDALINKVNGFGADVEIAPKKASVSLRRKRQFALIQPSTKTRVDLGLKFNDRATGDRLGGSGPFGAMCTHRVQLFDVADVDDELIGWIREAYDEAG